MKANLSFSGKKHLFGNILPAICLVLIGILFACSCKKNISAAKPIEKVNYPLSKFSMGTDLSYADIMQDAGKVYRDSGKVKDVFSIMKAHGCNTVRLRLWHTPSAYGNAGDQRYNSLPQVEKLIAKAKAAGMAVSLDFHYSDTWADPSKQYTPKAWENLNLSVLKDSVYNYTSYVLDYLKGKNLVPEMIQVCNEANSGILWPVGKVINNDFSPFSELLNSAIKAVRDFSQTSTIKPKIILHVATLEVSDHWLASLKNAGTTDFDVIGLSHYTNWGQIQAMNAITANIRYLKDKYKKEVMIVETAYWWNPLDARGAPHLEKALTGRGYSLTPYGQADYLRDLTQAVIKGGGTGVHYWAPDYMNANGGELSARSLFDYNGNLLYGVNFMNYPYRFE